VAAFVDKAPAWFYKSVFGMKSYITVEMAKKYLDSSSDNLVSFDRRVIRGKVLNDPRYLSQKPIVSKERSFASERSSTTTGSSEMKTIGGARLRQESKLLELRRDISSDKEKQALKLSDDSKESLISDDD
jgi:hypothetical protein